MAFLLFVLLPIDLHKHRVDAGHGTRHRELGVSRDHLQRQPAMWEELAHRRELGPVEMDTALPELGPGLELDLVGVGIGTDQDLAVEGGVGLERKVRFCSLWV